MKKLIVFIFSLFLVAGLYASPPPDDDIPTINIETITNQPAAIVNRFESISFDTQYRENDRQYSRGVNINNYQSPFIEKRLLPTIRKL